MLYNIGDFVDFVERPAQTPPPDQWDGCLTYLLRLHPNHELKAERCLHERGIAAYVPKEKRTIKTGWNRRRSRDVAIFPGSMFIPEFAADIDKLKEASQGVGGFVKYDGQCLKISPERMAEVRRFEGKRNGIMPRRKFAVDQKVRIITGPFEMLEGCIDRLDSNYRLRVLIQILKGEVPIEIDEDQVEAV